MRVKDDDDSSWSMFWQPETNYANHGLRFFSHANPNTLHLWSAFASIVDVSYTWLNNIFCRKQMNIFVFWFSDLYSNFYPIIKLVESFN